jgi:transcriptional regulator with XRE-family HTH domain
VTPEDLTQRRKALGLSVPQLAQRLGIPRATVYRWELGRMPIQHETILSLALETLSRNVSTSTTFEPANSDDEPT